jgi:nicotinamidase-related amidase
LDENRSDGYAFAVIKTPSFMKPLLLTLLASSGLLGAAVPTQRPPTLLDLAGARYGAGRLSESVVLVIDAQREYSEGRLPLSGIVPAVDEAARVLARARAAGTPVVHILQLGRKGGAFDLDSAMVEEIAALVPRPGETIVTKRLPNSFADTTLQEVLIQTKRKHLILVGFMTHMCVSSTARAALDLGYRCTVVSTACATRDLPGEDGSVIPAATVQQAELAALADRFACVVQGAAELVE